MVNMTTTKVQKTYLGKGSSRITVWAVRAYRTIGGVEVYETLGTWATEAEAEAQAARA